MLILNKQDVKILPNTSSSHKVGISDLTLQYRNRTYTKLNIAFNISQLDKAKDFCQSFQQDEDKQYLLVTERYGYSIWGEVKEEQLAEKPVTQPDRSNHQTSASEPQPEVEFLSSKNTPDITQMVLVTIQTIADDIEDLMGKRKKATFYQEVSRLFKQSLMPGAASPESIDRLLNIDPLTAKDLPEWQQKHLEAFLPKLARLGKKYYGNTTFIELIVDKIRSLPLYDRPQVADLCLQFVLSMPSLAVCYVGVIGSILG